MNSTTAPATGISRGGLLLAFLGFGVFSSALGAAATWWVLSHYSVQVPIIGQPLSISLPDELPVKVDILEPKPGEPPMQELGKLPLRLEDTLKVNIKLDTTIPLQMVVPLQTNIPIKGVVPLDTWISTRVLGIPMRLPVSGKVPLDFKLPLNLRIPIDQPVRIKFTAPIDVHVNDTIEVPMRAGQAMRIRFETDTLPITIKSGEFTVPLSDVDLTKNDKP